MAQDSDRNDPAGSMSHDLRQRGPHVEFSEPCTGIDRGHVDRSHPWLYGNSDPSAEHSICGNGKQHHTRWRYAKKMLLDPIGCAVFGAVAKPGISSSGS